jgi:hypothetical protein
LTEVPNYDPPLTEEQRRQQSQDAYVKNASRLIEMARAGNIDAFGAYVLRDESGGPIDIAPIHKSWTNFCKYCFEHNKYAGILASWRHGKSLAMVVRLALWEIGWNPEIRIRVVCGDDDEAIKRVAAIQRFLGAKEYRAVFPHVRPSPNADWTRHRLFVDRKALGPDPTLEAAGVGTSEAGGGNDLIILDDVVTYQNTINSPAKKDQIYNTLVSVWLRRINPDTRVVLIGTTWAYDDSYQLLMNHGGPKWLFLVQGVDDAFGGFDCEVREGGTIPVQEPTLI